MVALLEDKVAGKRVLDHSASPITFDEDNMKCSQCNSEMLEGSVSIKASGISLGPELTRPSAELSFDEECVISSKKGSFGFQRKTKYDAYVCEEYSLLTFKYD